MTQVRTYMIEHNGKIVGPYTRTQLESMWRIGMLTAADRYCESRGGEWRPLVQLLEPAQPKAAPPDLPARRGRAAMAERITAGKVLQWLLLLSFGSVVAIVVLQALPKPLPRQHVTLALQSGTGVRWYQDAVVLDRRDGYVKFKTPDGMGGWTVVEHSGDYRMEAK